MSGQSRGHETRQRILEEACKVFGEKGYRDATHAEICQRAGANVAAINYYFGTKEALYRAAFTHLNEKADLLYPLDGGLSTDTPPEQRLHAFIEAFLRRFFDPERLGHLHRIHMAEMFDSTGLLEELSEERLARNRGYILGILRQLLGPQASQRDLHWCEMSIISQCMVPPNREPNHKGPRTIFGLVASEVDRLAEHIFAFSLAGIRAIGQRTQEETEAVRGTAKPRTKNRD